MHHLHRIHRNGKRAFAIMALLLLCTTAPSAFAQDLIPKPDLAIPIPNVSLTDIRVQATDGEAGVSGFIDIPWIAQYISGVYVYGVSVAGVIAGVTIVIGGFQYMTGKPAEGKEKIKRSLIGVTLVFGSFIILKTINPDLTIVNSLRVKTLKRSEFTAEHKEDYGDVAEEGKNAPPTDPSAPSSGGGRATPVCKTIESCRAMCAGTRPKTSTGIMDPSLAREIPTIDGLVGNHKTASQKVIDGLVKAAGIAHARGYTIMVSDAYRSLQSQINKICVDVGNAEKEATWGKAVAWPGGSNHGAGYAVDLRLVRDSDKKTVVGSGSCSGQSAGTLATAADSKLFDQIMTEAGAQRYKREIWHYEFGSDPTCRCTYPNCPSPPLSCDSPC